MLAAAARSAAFSALTLLLAIGAAGETSADDAREIVRAGCRVRTEQIDARGIATIAAECHWPVAADALLAILRSPEKLGRALSSLKVCKRLPDGRVFQVHSVGWPLDDRQVTLVWRETALPDGGAQIHSQRAAVQEPLGAGRVMILDSEGSWEIRPDGTGGTLLSYHSRYDAGGNLKPWLVRRFQKDGIASSLEELRAAAASR